MGDINTNIRIDELESYVKNSMEPGIERELSTINESLRFLMANHVRMVDLDVDLSDSSTSIPATEMEPFVNTIKTLKPAVMNLYDEDSEHQYQLTQFEVEDDRFITTFHRFIGDPAADHFTKLEFVRGVSAWTMYVTDIT